MENIIFEIWNNIFTFNMLNKHITIPRISCPKTVNLVFLAFFVILLLFLSKKAWRVQLLANY